MDDAESDQEQREMVARVAGGWLPADFADAEIGAPTPAESDEMSAMLTENLGEDEFRRIMDEDAQPGEAVAVPLSSAEHRVLDEAAQRAGIDIVDDHGDRGHAA